VLHSREMRRNCFTKESASRMRASVVVPALVFALALAARAQERPSEPPPQKTTLAFDKPPADWKAHPKESKPFVADFDLPAAEGDGEGTRANVLSYPMGFEDYVAKIGRSWRHADGTPWDTSKLDVQTIEANDLKLRAVELSGTQAPQHGPARENVKLVLVHIRGGGGKWTAWLEGPIKSVDKHREAYLAWLKTAREVAVARPQETDAVMKDDEVFTVEESA